MTCWLPWALHLYLSFFINGIEPMPCLLRQLIPVHVLLSPTTKETTDISRVWHGAKLASRPSNMWKIHDSIINMRLSFERSDVSSFFSVPGLDENRPLFAGGTLMTSNSVKSSRRVESCMRDLLSPSAYRFGAHRYGLKGYIRKATPLG